MWWALWSCRSMRKAKTISFRFQRYLSIAGNFAYTSCKFWNVDQLWVLLFRQWSLLSRSPFRGCNEPGVERYYYPEMECWEYRDGGWRRVQAVREKQRVACSEWFVWAESNLDAAAPMAAAPNYLVSEYLLIIPEINPVISMKYTV